MFFGYEIPTFVRPLSLILSGLFLGIVFEQIILRRLISAAERTTWRADNVILRSLRGLGFIWFFVLGVYLAVIFNANVSDKMIRVFEMLLICAIILSGTIVIARIATTLVAYYSRSVKGAYPSTSIFTNLTKLFVYSMGILVVLNSLGVSILPALTALGVGGLAVGLALQGPLSNFFSGLQILTSKQINPGDFIKLDTGEEGFVTDITWRNTMIRLMQNHLLIVPNSKLVAAVVTNFNMPNKATILSVQFGVSYSSDLDKVETATKETAEEVLREIGMPDYEPSVMFTNFAESSIQVTVELRSKEYNDQQLVRHEFIKRLHRRYNAEEIEIPFPIRTVYNREAFKGHEEDLKTPSRSALRTPAGR